MATRLLVADDHDMFRECVVQRLEEEEDFEVVAHVGDASEAAHLARDLIPDVVLLDINMPGSPFIAGQEILRNYAATRLIYVTAHLSDQSIDECLRVGAHGFVTKRHSCDRLVEAIRAVLGGEYYFVPEALERLVLDGDVPVLSGVTRSSLLSPRERGVLRLLAEGQSLKQVAQMLCVSYKTVDNQTSSVMKKLALHSRTELVRYAIREQMAVV